MNQRVLRTRRPLRRSLVCVSLVAVGALGLAACGSSTSDETSPATETSPTTAASPAEVQVGFGFPYTTVEVYKPLIAGAKEEAETLNATIRESSAALNSGAQVAELNTWIAAKVNALVVLPMDLSALAPVVKTAHDAGTKVIGYAADIDGDDGSIKWSDAQGAQAAGDATAAWVTSKGGSAQVGLLTQDSVETGKTRVHGTVDELQAKVPDAKVVASAEASDAASGYKVALTMLQAHPDISVIICANDDIEVGAERAIQQLHMATDSVFLVGFDGSLTALKQINSGQINGITMALPLEDIGKAVTEFAVNAVRGSGPTSKVFDYVLAKNNDSGTVEPLIDAYGK